MNSRHRPPVRIVHLGVGAFHRAHQAWYTDQAADAADWGIAGFTGRTPAVADLLAAQDGRYTIVERGANGDAFHRVDSLVQVTDGDRLDRLGAALAAPATAIVTLTVTEAGYRLGHDGEPDPTDPAVKADRTLLRTLGKSPAVPVTTALGRLVAGLERRRRAAAPPLAVVPCDNLADGAARVAHAVGVLAADVSPHLPDWIAGNVSFVATSVDRITPRTEPDLPDLVFAATGWRDAAPVATEPFSDWVLCGNFPSGRPAWESAGARFVTDIEPWEARKLWLLNGAHTLLACDGQLRGHSTIAEAIGDPCCRRAVDALWDEAARHLPDDLDLPTYRAALLQRFANARIRHQLTQIAADSSTKLRLRVVPVALRERRAGRSATGCAHVIGAWIRFVLDGGGIHDSDTDTIRAAAAGAEPLRALIAVLDAGLAGDHGFVDTVRTSVPMTRNSHR